MKISGVSSVTAEMTSRVRLIRSGIRLLGRFPTIAYRIRSLLPFGNAKCRGVQLRVVRTVARRTSISPRRVCHDVYKSIVAEKERERILLRAERHANVLPIFLSRTPSSPNSENVQINCAWKERRGRDSKSKGSIKSCRCVSRAQQRGRCQKGLLRDSVGEAGAATRMGSHFAHLPSHKADTTVLSSKIHKSCPAA